MEYVVDFADGSQMVFDTVHSWDIGDGVITVNRIVELVDWTRWYLREVSP